MSMKTHTRIDLAEGGNIFKQGDHVSLGFTPRDYAGNVEVLTGKDIAVVIWSRKGIMYEGEATFDSEAQLIRLEIEETLQHGDFNIEFTVTDSTDAGYRKKFPSGDYDGKISIKPSADNIDVVGVQMTTVSQLRQEQIIAQQTFEANVLPRVETVETTAAELSQRVEDGIGAFTEDTEVLDARMGEVNLREFNRKTTEKLAETANETNALKSTKANNSVISSLDERISTIVAHNGDGTKDSEIIDSRFGVDGQLNTSLKSRLDNADYLNMLLSEPAAKQAVTLDSNGKVQKITYTNPETNEFVREDSFTHAEGLITETRVLANGLSVIFKYNLITFETDMVSLAPVIVKNELVYDRDTWTPWVLGANASVVDKKLKLTATGTASFTFLNGAFKPNTKYGILYNIISNDLNNNFRMSGELAGATTTLASPAIAGKRKYVFTSQSTITQNRFTLNTASTTGAIVTDGWRIFELPSGSNIERDFTELTAEQLMVKYPWN